MVRDLSTRRPFHPFPARMAPSIALAELDSGDGKSLRVLDPMSGSGTALVVARGLGHSSVGVDTDPLAVLLARTACSDVPRSLVETGSRILREAKDRYRSVRLRDAYPPGASKETKAFVRYWFDPTNRKQLRALSDSIGSMRKCPSRDFLWCAFSRLIIVKSHGASRAMDLSHSRPHRAFERGQIRPLAEFARSVDYVAARAPFRGGASLPRSDVSLGDARDLKIDNKSVDLVITSPPYLNAIDYLRCSKFSLVWMGHDAESLRSIRSGMIGAEVSTPEALVAREVMKAHGRLASLPPRWRSVLGRFIIDMDRVLAESSRVLVDDGRAVFVVGDSNMRGVYVRNSKIISLLSERHGLKVASITRRRLPDRLRYLPPPKRSESSDGRLATRMRTEAIITLTKTGG